MAEERTMQGWDGSEVRYPLHRLRTVDDLTHRPGQMPKPGEHRTVDIRRVERSDLLCRDALGSPMNGERPETRLSKSFERCLMSQGYAVHRARIRHSPQCAPMLTDTWVAQLRLLIEAKARKNPTHDVRYAVGQLGQYTRDLRAVYEVIWGQPLDPSNFRRKVLNTTGFVQPTGDQWLPPTGRPAALYRRGHAWLLNPPLLRAATSGQRG
ncbi:NrtR DNA-binding winged helix domain-containing protein [Streptomyces coeruleorubidus]|uniref:NrtR DNA-binding winged helix domain-containing protein n=1 Tax=Streptomyces coeruleorubidus TaxID=116188 RepID=UPI00365740D4